jgi:hypothetical protein
MDPDDKVRRFVVETVIAIVKAHPNLISEELRSKLRDRTRDKKRVLREYTLQMCCRLWPSVQHNKDWHWIVNSLLRYHAEKDDSDNK